MDQTAFNFDSIPPSDEAAVLSMLREGRQAAVSSTIIEARTGLRPRRVQQIIRKLRLEGHSIGSATQDPMGYYLTSEPGTCRMISSSVISRQTMPCSLRPSAFQRRPVSSDRS